MGVAPPPLATRDLVGETPFSGEGVTAEYTGDGMLESRDWVVMATAGESGSDDAVLAAVTATELAVGKGIWKLCGVVGVDAGPPGVL